MARRAKEAAFLLVALAIPFLLIGLLEIALRAGNYGGDTSPFATPAQFHGDYRIPGPNVARRYFPQERQPPSPPADAFLVRKPAHSLRIFVMGESSAAGFPYARNGTFSSVLQDALSDVLTSDTVEIVNMGIAATNSYTIADLTDDVIRQAPDAIIIYGGHNEYYGALGAGSTETLGSYPSFVRLYLSFQRFRTFVLLRNATTSMLRLIRGGRSTGEIEADATRMESVVGDQGIVLNGQTYQRGVAQYRSNLLNSMNAFKAAGIPVFIGSTPSNIRDLPPFGVAAIPPDTAATIDFRTATELLQTGDSIRASDAFSRARDLDVIRFRAPSEFQRVVQGVARVTGATYVPVLEGIAAASRYRIPGNDLFFEHVHPKKHGYVLIASMYFDALQQQGFLGRRADMSRFAGWESYASRMQLTALDDRIAYHTIRTVTTRWPFVPVSRQQDYRGSYRPVDFLDSLAFAVSRGGLPWAQAKAELGDRYSSAGDVDHAVAEYAGLIRDEPRIEIGWRLAAKALLSANQAERARAYLEQAYSIEPSAFTAFSLGVMAMQAKNIGRGIPLLEEAVRLDASSAPAMFQLSLAYAVARNIDGARAMAQRVAGIAPGYPGLGEWMAALGLTQSK
ncbi:MAG: hypothetical protein ABIS03_09620 [Gemmatimonadaceae bacterium]